MVVGTGRKKIEIKRRESKVERMVTFSKRRKGLFRKAMELYAISGCQIAILVFSPASRPYVEGHPDFDSVLDQFLAKYYSDRSGYSNSPSPTTSGAAIPIQPPGCQLSEEDEDDDNAAVSSDEDDDCDDDDDDDDDDRDWVRNTWLERMRVEEVDEEEQLLFLKQELENGRIDIVKDLSRKLIQSHKAFVA